MEVRASNSILYLVPNLVLRGASFILTPLYTRAWAADFAIVAVANSLITVLSIVLGMGLSGCIPRLFFEYKDGEQRRLFGTLLSVLLVVPAAVVGVLYVLGLYGYLDVFETIRFSPHIKLVLLTSLFSIYTPLPISVYQAREEPRKVAVLSGLGAISQLGFTIALVSGLHQGAVGVLRANLFSSAITGVVSIALMAKRQAFRRSCRALDARSASAYRSYPIWPPTGHWRFPIASSSTDMSLRPTSGATRSPTCSASSSLSWRLPSATRSGRWPIAN